MKNVAIFWDFDNVHLTIQEKFGIDNNYLIELIDKVNSMFEQDSIRVFRAYADFEKISKVQSIIQKKRVTPKHVFSSNSGTENRKNASDIELCLDALEITLTKEEIDLIVVISADKDMIPLMNRLRFYGKETKLIFLKESLAEDELILDFVDSHISIEELISLSKINVEELSLSELERGAIDAVNMVKDFYERNVDKPKMFYGISFYKQDMLSKKGHPGEVSMKILEHCESNGVLKIEKIGTNQMKITTNAEVLIQLD